MNVLVGVVGYSLRANSNNIDLIERLLSERASPYTENEVFEATFTHSIALL